MTRLRLWLKRLLLLAVWLIAYWILPAPLDDWMAAVTVAGFGIWLYNRVCGRLKLSPLAIKFERIETITFTHVLLALLLLAVFANYSELVKLNKNTAAVRDDIVDLQNAASDNTDKITDGLDDVKGAVEANQ